jgi:hypothetical protein
MNESLISVAAFEAAFGILDECLADDSIGVAHEQPERFVTRSRDQGDQMSL